MKPEQKNFLIHKYLTKQSNSAENEQVESWVKGSKEAEREFNTIETIWDQSQQVDFDLDPATDTEWAKLKQQIGGKTVRPIKKSNFRWIGVAAAVVILLGGIWLVKQFGEDPVRSPQQYATHAGEIKKIVLADGSKVTLNGSSQLTIDADFDVNNRLVTLEGEAFFEVTKQKEGQNFRIKTAETEVKVLGTQFNVQAYNNFQTTTVNVAEGRVEYSAINKQSAVLKAGQGAVYHKQDKKLVAQNLSHENIGNWQKGILAFEKEPFDDVLKTLENKFGVTIQNQTAISTVSYSAIFDNEDLNDILETIAFSFELKVEQKGKEITLKK
ncbi:MAG: DUF4974 domain-containing protein [Aureispira sp.]|nr:DUF4974 domain-containing protein [Aureispira sp.]